MMQQLLGLFLARFVEDGHDRTRRAAEACGPRFDLAAGELHALAGEAALLGLEGIDALARQGEQAARRRSIDECERILDEIERALAELAASEGWCDGRSERDGRDG